MHGLKRFVAVCALAVAVPTGAAAPPFDGAADGLNVNFIELEAAAWRGGGKQMLTVDGSNTPLFWDRDSERLIDTIGLDLPPATHTDYRFDRKTVLLMSPDDRYAAVSTRAKSGSVMTLLIDLPGQRTIATLARAALFWTGNRLVVGLCCGCTTACGFALADPVTTAETAMATTSPRAATAAASPPSRPPAIRKRW